MPLLMEKEEEGMLTPMLQTTECTFSYIKYNNLYIVSTTKKNANIALVFVFLHKIVQVLSQFLIYYNFHMAQNKIYQSVD